MEASCLLTQWPQQTESTVLGEQDGAAQQSLIDLCYSEQG